VSAERRTSRDARRRRLGQNFLRPDVAERLVAEVGFRPGERVIEVGAGRGALTEALVRRGVHVRAVEIDPLWARELRQSVRRWGPGTARVVEADFLSLPLPRDPFRLVGDLPFGRTTAILRRLLDDPRVPLVRADLLVQWEVARKRAAAPPATLRSAAWAPWWEIRLGPRIPARAFRPVPRVDAGLLVVTRRHPPLLPTAMAGPYHRFVRSHWPFEGPREGR
jgi:23S rRNA (adenine-N6)-dimethyltransferase